MATREHAPDPDPIDTRIVRTMMADGRATLSVLAAATGLSVSAVQARLQRLEKRGVITGYRATVDWEAIDLPVSAFVAVILQDYSHQEQLPELLRNVDGVVSCYSIAGAPSYLLRVRTASLSALEDLINTIHRVAPVSTETTMVLRAYFEDEPPVAGD
ncbi:Lrp/AsnC family transcriptional regulator [Actinomyces sp.]|uniref:Lrp/AsnC family transcriptional regulator n=1 Tax=Actinomyces sp. TaxID=29317 RepID=UPI002899A283|nr:Lrp/AsnC family transcriptional regulator [Actinomyces sp.]